MDYAKLKNNPLKDYNDVKTACEDSIAPYLPFFTPGYAGIDIGLPGASYSHKAACLEGFARILWGWVPYLAGGNTIPDWDKFLTGLANGVNPGHPEFWGLPGDYDQRLVEMAVLGFALCLVPQHFWDPLSAKAKKDLAAWLACINNRKIPDCNWLFFRVLVNCGLQTVGAGEYDAGAVQECLALAEKFYTGGGWYNDGYPGERRAFDYYNPWAFQYYSLLVLTAWPCLDAGLAQAYRERVRLFAGDFHYWFAADGSALPFGRSLTYRYAQAAFWGAAAFAGEEVLPWGQVKGLYLRNLRWWFRQPVYSETGLLSIGYAYPNQYMAERYNSYNSPLWALKTFIPLALPEEHPFWQAAEAPLPDREEQHLQPVTGFLVCGEKASGHLYALNAGQWIPGDGNNHNHMAEKYAKFAYSNHFGFSVATDAYGIDKLAPDNMLLLSKGDDIFRCRTATTGHIITKEYLYSVWKPLAGITVETWLAACGAWSLRLHRISAECAFTAVEGGFALPFGDSFYPAPERFYKAAGNEASWSTEGGFSGIRGLASGRNGRLVIANPNSNLLHARTLVPVLEGRYDPGQHWLGCAVLAHPEAAQGEKMWNVVDIQELFSRLPVRI